MSLQNNRRYWGSSIFWSSYQRYIRNRGELQQTVRVLRREVHARSKIALRPLPLRKGTFVLFEGVFIAVFLTSISFQSKVPMARPGCSRVGGALVMAASSVLGYIGQARVPFWSSDNILWALHAIFSPLSCYRNGCLDRLH